MRPLHPRQADILKIAKRDGRVDVDGLATHFDVTPQTIRKDLNDLCEIDALQRFYSLVLNVHLILCDNCYVFIVNLSILELDLFKKFWCYKVHDLSFYVW